MTDPGGSSTVDRGPSPPRDERELAERIRTGEVAAFDAFVKAQWAPLVRYAISFLGSTDDAKDVAQEAFVRLWEQRSGLRPSGSLRAYLYQIARNLAINERKRRVLHGTLASRAAEEQPPVPTPAQELAKTELRVIVERAIESLPDRRREAFVLAHLQNLPHREVAEVMGISVQTVANQISAALADLRRMLAPQLKASDGHDVERSANGHA